MNAAQNAPDIDRLFRQYRESGRRRLRNELVRAHEGLAGHIAKDYAGRGVEYDDLRQVAMLGLLKSVERYDPERGVPFGPFASRTINGELKRHFRDKTWSVRPPRGMLELRQSMRRTTEELTQKLGRAPTVPELARALDATEDEILESMEAGGAYRADSLDAPTPGDGDERLKLGDRLAGDDPSMGRSELRVLVAQLMESVPEREATILRLRFVDEMTQSEIAEVVGVSQMHVSRLLRRTLRDLRARLEAADAAIDEDQL